LGAGHDAAHDLAKEVGVLNPIALVFGGVVAAVVSRTIRPE
jgi:hypothetical protein